MPVPRRADAVVRHRPGREALPLLRLRRGRRRLQVRDGDRGARLPVGARVAGRAGGGRARGRGGGPAGGQAPRARAAAARPARPHRDLLRARAVGVARGGRGARVPARARAQRGARCASSASATRRRRGTRCSTPRGARASRTRRCSRPGWRCGAARAGSTTSSAARSCSRWPTRRGRVRGSGRGRCGTARGRSTSTRARARCSRRAGSCSAPTSRARRRRSRAPSCWRRATPTSSRSTRRASRNAVGAMGTALTAEQAQPAPRLAPVVLLCLDADAAGQQAAVARGVRAPGPRSSSASSRCRRAPTRRTSWGRRAAPSACAALLERVGPVRALRDRAHPRARPRRRGPDPGRQHHPAPAAGHPPRRVSSSSPPAGSGSRRSSSRARSLRAARRRRPPVADAAPAARASNGARQALDRREQSERAFLALCVALPELGEAKLAAADLDAVFTSPLTRLAAERLRGHLEHPSSVIGDAPELAELIPEIVLRAGQLDATPATLELEALQLDLHRLDREITAARTGGEAPIGRPRRRAPEGPRRDPPPPAVEPKVRPTHELVFVSWIATGSKPNSPQAARSSRSRRRSASTPLPPPRPALKRFAVSHAGTTGSLRSRREEARKCVLLCANCHAEVEAGLVLLASPADNPG